MQTLTKLFRNTLTIATLMFALSAIDAAAATFTVTNTNNSGAGSLRQAVTDSNNAAGSDTIVFDSVIFGTPQMIQLASAILRFSGDRRITDDHGTGRRIADDQR
jgi:hypothetical protein